MKNKEERVKIVNLIIAEIAKYDRRFFHSKGNVAEIFIKNNKLYYKCEWTSERLRKPITEICLSVPDYITPKGWYHGGTLLALVRDFCHYIRTGEPSNHKHGYGGLYCPHWGYKPESMQAIQNLAIELKYLEP